MAKDPFEKVLQKEQQALKQDLLHDVPVERYPERIDWLARQVALDGEYMLRQPSGKQTYISRSNFDKAARELYLSGLADATGSVGYLSALDGKYPLGELIVQYAELIEGLTRVNEHGVDPGEALGRLIARDLRRNTEGQAATIASDFQSETYTPRGLVEQVVTHPELAGRVRSVIPSEGATAELVDRLGEVKIATRLWDHQLIALCKWLDQGANGYVNMATATGKTVLGLAAVAYWTDSGALHPADATELEKWFDPETPPEPDSSRASDVLIVTTDELLGVQWARLFNEHCNTPSEFTEVVDQTISLPWGDIDIISANAVDDTDPSDYRVAIFDEVHNYSSGGGWGNDLAKYIDSSCPVLALTGSVNEAIERRFRKADSNVPCVYTYTHEEALRDGVIPDFNWTLQYTPIDKAKSSTADTLRETTQLFEEFASWEDSTYRLCESNSTVQSLPSELRAEVTEPHESPVSLGRTISSSDENSEISDELLKLANGMSNRRTYWWNLRLGTQPIVELVRGAMSSNQPALLLTRSYRESDRLFKQLRQACDDIKIQKLEQGEDADTQDNRITTFDSWETDRKVLIGPGDRIGTGNDIQCVEVGINLARPGTGMSNSLVQRLGRLLRQPGNKESVDFYHLLGVPPAESVAPMDGEHFVRNAAGFFAQTKNTGENRMVKVPRITVSSDVSRSIQYLERYGGKALAAPDATLDKYEQAYVDAIIASSENRTVIDTDWYESLFDEETATASLVNLEGEDEPSKPLRPTEKTLDTPEETTRAKRSDPKTKTGDCDTGETIEEPFRATADTSKLDSKSSVVSTLLLHLKNRCAETDGTVMFDAFDPLGNQIRLVVKDEFEEELLPGHYYRFNNVKSIHDQDSGLSQVTVTADSTVKDSADSKLFVAPESLNKAQSPEMTRQERVSHHLLITDQEQLTTEIDARLKTISKQIHELDIHEFDLQAGLDRLTEIETDLNAISPENTGVESQRLKDIRTRVSEQLKKLKNIKDILISAQRKISLAKTSDTIPAQDLHDVDKKLQDAISISEELGCDTTQLETLEEDIEELTEDSQTSETDTISDSDTDEPTDTEPDIQPNEVSEYYDALRNLKQLTDVVQEAVDGHDEPMEHWCDTVNAFHLGEMDDYACYGKLQSDLNEFSMSQYRDTYGNGNRTTEFHVIDTEPLTETVQNLIENTVSDQAVVDVHLPVAPDSGARLPVIVETDAELARAVSLLKELPKSPNPAASVDEPPEASPRTVGDEPDAGDIDDTSGGENEEESPNDKEPLTEIGGVTEDVVAVLHREGITTRTQLTEIDLDALAQIDGIGSGIAQRIKMQVG